MNSLLKMNFGTFYSIFQKRTWNLKYLVFGMNEDANNRSSILIHNI
jgi:hypothetical protein